MTMAMRVPAKVEQVLKLKDGAQMVIITPNPNLGRKAVRIMELVLSSSPGNELEAMVATVPSKTETMVPTSWARTEHWSKPRSKSVFPAKRKSVKRMMFELVLSSSPGNGSEAMIATVPRNTETMVPTSRARTEHWSKPRSKSVFPAKRKSVKRMMFESIVRFIASLFRSQSRGNSIVTLSAPPSLSL